MYLFISLSTEIMIDFQKEMSLICHTHLLFLKKAKFC